MPAERVSSFSGMRPTLSRTVSHSSTISEPGMGARLSSTWLMTTRSTRSLPWMSVMVWLR